jgi:hypothetical protein
MQQIGARFSRTSNSGIAFNVMGLHFEPIIKAPGDGMGYSPASRRLCGHDCKAATMTLRQGFNASDLSDRLLGPEAMICGTAARRSAHVECPETVWFHIENKEPFAPSPALGCRQ